MLDLILWFRVVVVLFTVDLCDYCYLGLLCFDNLISGSLVNWLNLCFYCGFC